MEQDYQRKNRAAYHDFNGDALCPRLINTKGSNPSDPSLRPSREDGGSVSLAWPTIVLPLQGFFKLCLSFAFVFRSIVAVVNDRSPLVVLRSHNAAVRATLGLDVTICEVKME